MAVISASALRAYGVYRDPNNTPQKQAVVPSPRETPDTQSPSDTAVLQKPDAGAVVINTTHRSSESPQKNQPAQVNSLLDEGGEEETPLPSREEVEGLSRRYFAVLGNANPAKEEVRKLSDFYGASPARLARLKDLVSGLESGQESESLPSGSVAVA